MRKRVLRSFYRSARELFYVASLAAGLVVPTPTLAVGVDKLVSDVCLTSTDAAFREKYCKAAKDNKKSYVANKTTAMVWGGVTVACGAACGKAYANIYCKGMSSAGSATDGAITKKFVSSILGEASNYKNEITGGGTATADAGTSASTGGMDSDACEAAAKSASKSYEKISNSQQNEKSLADLRDQTKQMNTGKSGSQNYLAGADAAGSATGTGAQTAADTADVCDTSAMQSALGAIRCAASADPSLPPYVKSEQFLKDVAKASGKTPDAFFSEFESPAKSLLESPALDGLSTSGKQGVAESLSAMEKAANSQRFVASTGSNDGYRSGKGSKPSGAGEEDSGFDMNGALAGALGALGNHPTEEAAPGVNSISVGARNPASGKVISPEDRTISLFDRVKWRYGAISARDQLGFEMSGGHTK